MEQRIIRLKRFRNMIKSSISLQCKYCGKVLASEIFSAHLSVCIHDHHIENHELPLRINVTQTLIREDFDCKPCTV